MNSPLIFITSEIAQYLLFASVISTILVTMAWGIIKLGKIQAPVYHHMIWLCTLIAVLALPVMWLYGPKLPVAILPAQSHPDLTLTQQVKFQPVAVAEEESLLKIEASGPNAAISPSKLYLNQLRSIPINNTLAGLWCAGFIFMLIRLLIGWHQLARIVRSAEPVSNKIPFRNFFPNKLKLLLTSDIDSPVCCGLLRPVILLPKRMHDNDSLENLQMVLSHELAHIERRDFLVNIFQRLIEAVLFFHPLVWYASFQLTHTREQICDHHVIAKGASPGNYAQLLTRIVEQGFKKNNFHAVALFEGRLLLRVRSLFEHGNKIRLKTSRRETIAGAMILLLCMASGAIRLEAKSTINSDPESIQNQSPQSINIKKDSTGPISNNHQAESFKLQKEIPPKNGKRPKGNCSVSGKVVSAETGEPLGRATVMLFNIETSDVIHVEVAGDGNFLFKDIPNGQYGLHGGKTAGFQDSCYNPGNGNGQVPFFSLKDGEKRSGLILKLKPAYSLSGKVLGEDGQPIRDSRLGVLAWVKSDKQKENLNRYEIARQTLVSPDGSYQLAGLDNRPVYVMVIDFGSEEKDQPWAPCYFPGSASKEQAQMVSFNKDRSVENINIQLTKKGEFILKGDGADQKPGMPISKSASPEVPG
jgi:beta-lactamase regulating signal transducer with metallopeptidase domain